MTRQKAFYIVGNIPIPTDDKHYDICQYQEAKAMALEALQAWDDVLDTLTHNYKVAEAQGEFDEAVAIIDCIRVIKDKIGDVDISDHV